MTTEVIKTADEALQRAIEWQYWMSEQSMSWGEVILWQDYFTALGERFGLVEEFKENGII